MFAGTALLVQLLGAEELLGAVEGIFLGLLVEVLTVAGGGLFLDLAGNTLSCHVWCKF